MTKKTRLILLLFCVVCFFILTPYIALYSLGYRVDFLHMKITATGGIYIKADPLPLEISIDSKPQKTNFLANSIFAQNLLPESHAVLIKKDGYYDYQKELEVIENQVTKLEHVLLFKKDILFDNLIDKTDYFSVSPDAKKIIFSIERPKGYPNKIQLNIFDTEDKSQKNLLELSLMEKIQDLKWSDDSRMVLLKTIKNSKTDFFLLDINKMTQGAPRVSQESTLSALTYLDKNSKQIYFNPQDSQELFFMENKKIYSVKNNNALAIISNAISYKISDNNIIWLSSEGFLLRSDISGKLIEKITSKGFVIDNQTTYEVFAVSSKIFLKENDALFTVESAAKTLEKFKIPITDYKLSASADGQKLICFNDKEIYIYLLSKPEKENTLLYSSSEKINNLFWLNNDYLIFNAGHKIIISEIDYRNSVNTITLQTESPEIFFNRQDNRLYVLTQNTLSASEKLTP